MCAWRCLCVACGLMQCGCCNGGSYHPNYTTLFIKRRAYNSTKSFSQLFPALPSETLGMAILIMLQRRTQSRTLLILLYRPNWLKTTVWPGWIHTAESDWAMLYMRPQPHTTEPRTRGGTKSSNAQCPQGSTLSTWRSSMRWGAHSVHTECEACSAAIAAKLMLS